jgi:putative ABC transport system permease protein
MLKDILGQAWEAMVYNRRRTAITMIGMAWGIATVVLLLAYGAGFGRAIQAIFEQWGTHTIGVFPGRTSQQAGGDKAGVKVRFTLDDVDRLSASVPGITQISPTANKDQVTVQTELRTFTWTVNGVRPSFADIRKLTPAQGRIFSGKEDQQRAHVCLIGSEAKTKLFSGGWALGEDIRLNGELFTIVGVLEPKMQEGDDNDINRQIYIPFNTMNDLMDTHYLGGIWFGYSGDNMLVEKAVRETMAAAHHFRPTDRNAVYVANLMTVLK